jgi:TolA-binding protein
VAIDRPEKRPLPNLITEEILYSEALRAHRAGDIGGQRFYHQELSRRYPQSHLLDNSLLLLGKALQKKGVLTRSLAYYQEIIDRYPRSDKRASAMLFKGMVYRELNLPEVARSSFLQVKKEYPGSPEFFQVDMEMKLLALKEKSS